MRTVVLPRILLPLLTKDGEWKRGQALQLAVKEPPLLAVSDGPGSPRKRGKKGRKAA
jgi:hypothetical protein